MRGGHGAVMPALDFEKEGGGGVDGGHLAWGFGFRAQGLGFRV